VLPFLDTSGVKVHLSEFGLLWSHLHSWVSPASLAYVNNRQADASSNSTSGRQNGLADDITKGTSSSDPSDVDVINVDGDVTPSLVVVQQRAAMVSVLAAALPHVVEQLGLLVPVSAFRQAAAGAGPELLHAWPPASPAEAAMAADCCPDAGSVVAAGGCQCCGRCSLVLDGLLAAPWTSWLPAWAVIWTGLVRCLICSSCRREE